MNKVITVSREFGSGGREFARRLADKLNFAYYDSEIITELAKRTNLAEEYISKKIEERNIAKKNKDYALADAIREELKNRGIFIKD